MSVSLSSNIDRCLIQIGESLHGTDDESEREPEDDYDIDNDFFVPHGYLSDEELQQNEDDFDYDNDPENHKVKLKLIQEKFNDEMKKQTHKLKPRIIGLIWQNADGSKPDNCSNLVWDLFDSNAMYFEGTSVKIEPPTVETNSDDETTSKPRRLKIGEKEIPDLIRLINGNQNNRNFLVRELQAHIAKTNQGKRAFSNTSIGEKIKELAFWQSCPEEGPMHKKMCWYVPRDTCKRYGVNDLTFPNTWSYTIAPRKPTGYEDLSNENKVKQNPQSEQFDEDDDVIEIDDDSNSRLGSETLTSQTVAQALMKPANYNIAKFIRVLSEEEKKKQFDPIKFRHGSSSNDEANDQPQLLKSVAKKKTKKRVSIMMSGPLGQELPSIKQYLESRVRKRKSSDSDLNNSSIGDNGTGNQNDRTSTKTAGTSDGTKKQKLNTPLIVID